MQMIKAISSSAACHKTNPNNLPNIKNELIKRQGGKCPITGRNLKGMTSINVVTDHCHKTGVIRAALPRAINGLEGKLTQNCTRWGGCTTRAEVIQMLRGMADYLELHSTAQTEWLHPSYMTPAEARQKKNAKARKTYKQNKES